VNNGTYTFKGTPPFTLIASNGITTQTVSGKTLFASALTITPTVIKDKTECPGIFCPYTGSDLYVDATHFCQQRTSGAKNWEAWIKDIRDSKLYRSVQIHTTWWLAENLQYDNAAGQVTCYGEKWYYRSTDMKCPANWDIPTAAKWQSRKTLETAYPDATAYGDLLPGGKHYVPGSGCRDNQNYHMMAEDHTTGHCYWPGSHLGQVLICNTNLAGAARCIRNL
jgi:hypothetical protein